MSIWDTVAPSSLPTSRKFSYGHVQRNVCVPVVSVPHRMQGPGRWESPVPAFSGLVAALLSQCGCCDTTRWALAQAPQRCCMRTFDYVSAT